MNLVDLYREMYYKENEIKNRLGTKLVPMITVLVTLSTAEIWIINRLLIIKLENNILQIITFVLLVFSIMGNIILFFLFYKAHYNYNYSYIKIKSIKEFKEKLDENKKIYSEKELEDHLNKGLINLFYNATNDNQRENIRKIENQNKLMIGYIIQLVVLIICFYWIELN